MTKDHLKILLIDFTFLLLTLLMLSQPTVERIVGILLTVYGAVNLVLYLLYITTKNVWLEVHSAKEKTNTSGNNSITIEDMLLPDLHDLVGSRTLKATLLMYGTFIVFGVLFFTHLYSDFILTAAKLVLDNFI